MRKLSPDLAVRRLGALAAAALCLAPATPRAGDGSQSLEVALGYDLYREPAVAKAAYTRFADPSLRAEFPSLQLGWLLRGTSIDSALRVDTHWPGQLRFDDGSGHDRVLARGRSRTFDLALGYDLDWWALRWPTVRLGLAGLATGAYHRTRLAYQAGGPTRSWDLSLGLGVGLPVEWLFLPRWRARAELRNLLYLPWLSTGAVTRVGATRAYGLSVWRTQLDLEVARGFGERWELAAGYAREEAVGLGVPPELRGEVGTVRVHASHRFLLRIRVDLPGSAP